MIFRRFLKGLVAGRTNRRRRSRRRKIMHNALRNAVDSLESSPLLNVTLHGTTGVSYKDIITSFRIRGQSFFIVNVCSGRRSI